MLRYMLLKIGLVLTLGTSTSWSLAQATNQGEGSWLLGFGPRIEAAVKVARDEVHNPGTISDLEFEAAISGLAEVSEKVESRFEKCVINKCSDQACDFRIKNRQDEEAVRRRVLNSRALVILFRNLLVLEINKPKGKRDFSLALRMGKRIRTYFKPRLSA